MRVGLGFDAHAFDHERSLVLGGVSISGTLGLAGHSDADVLSHAIADALLGAARLGDLGEHFPPDERWRDASSLDILGATAEMVAAAGFHVVNIDATIIAETPRLSPHRAEMAARIAAALEVEPDDISIKASTTDGLGSTGRSEGMAAMAVALVEHATGEPEERD